MKVIKAKTAGFCFGVKRAVDTVYDQVDICDGPIYTYGPIIHNEEVVKDMESKGVVVLRSEEELDSLQKGTVIIRSHRNEKKIYDKLEEKKLKTGDATWPFGKKIHNIVQKESAAGKRIVIIGNPDHPEVQGIVGHCKGECYVAQTPQELEKILKETGAGSVKNAILVAQTTFNTEIWGNFIIS